MTIAGATEKNRLASGAYFGFLVGGSTRPIRVTRGRVFDDDARITSGLRFQPGSTLRPRARGRVPRATDELGRLCAESRC